MENTNQFTCAQNDFNQFLKKADALTHKYHGILPNYLDYPYDQELTFDEIKKEIGEVQFERYSQQMEGHAASFEEQAMVEDLMHEMNPDDNNEPWRKKREDEEENLPITPQQDQQFRTLCNAVGSLNGTLVLNLCNLYGSLELKIRRPEALSMLYYANRSFLSMNGAITEMVPLLHFAKAAACASRSIRFLNATEKYFNAVEASNENKQIIESFHMLFRECRDKTAAFVSFCKTLSNLTGEM